MTDPVNVLINRQDAIDALTEAYEDIDAEWILKKLPVHEYARPGEWVPSTKYKGFLTCSACENCYIEIWSDREKKWKYCPECGSKMS